jgi:hypothetical protein
MVDLAGIGLGGRQLVRKACAPVATDAPLDRPVLLIEVNRVHQALRGIDFNEAVRSSLARTLLFC